MSKSQIKYLDINNYPKECQNPIFSFFNNLKNELLYANKILPLKCMRCGLERNFKLKNYLLNLKSIRLIYDEKYDGIFVCKKCSKFLQDTNKSILLKISNSLKLLSPEIKAKSKMWMSDKERVKMAAKKSIKTKKEKYGEDYFRKQIKNMDRKKSAETYKKNQNIKKQKCDILVDELILKIKNGEIKTLDNKNYIHKQAVKKLYGIRGRLHDMLFQYVVATSHDIEILKLTTKFTCDGLTKSGYVSTNRGWLKINGYLIQFDSSAELTFILWKNSEGFLLKRPHFFKYTLNNKEHKYFPDFIDQNDVIYEIKYKDDYIANKKIVDKKIKSCNAQLVFFENMPKTYKELAISLLKIYKTRKNDKK